MIDNIPTFLDWVKTQFQDEPHSIPDKIQPKHLTIEKAKQIERLLKTPMTTKQIALEVGASYWQVYYIQTKKRSKGN